jgi:hypothetical protein
MRKLIVAILFVAVIALPGFSLGVDFGISGTLPTSALSGNFSASDIIPGFHVGISPWFILYASWDSLVMNSGAIGGLTGTYLPGFLNLYDAGLRIILGPIVVLVEAGINNVYVYKQGVTGANGLGANLRVGLGLKFKWWGITATGTSVFPNFTNLVDTVKGLFYPDSQRLSLYYILNGLYPGVMAVIYL